MLLSRSGTVVTREELQRKLFTWRFGEVKPTPRPERRFWSATGTHEDLVVRPCDSFAWQESGFLEILAN
jgi:hypothetical protein